VSAVGDVVESPPSLAQPLNAAIGANNSAPAKIIDLGMLAA
jgi:hypothetical protein